MATYVIGDVQGCFSALKKLLEKIQFDSAKDSVWFTGDLVNRGPQSLETLRFIKNLPDCKVVLGNHDLHLLALSQKSHPGQHDDTLIPILTAPDRDELLNWLLQQPLLHHDATLGYTMIHAGLAPSWDLTTAKKLASEVETILQSAERDNFFRHMYGDQPNYWDENLQGFDRLRCITNYFTRARFCHPDGSLELKTKEKMTVSSSELIPWFSLPQRKNSELKIIFGHWAALAGVTNTPRVYGLDTGCVWGFCLTAMRLEDEKRFSVPCNEIVI
jgi:bis(5'-nucleosyl)-tetraphosphatase (symmetrical)